MKSDIFKNIKREFILFLIGGMIYSLIEIFGRGFTHPSMFIVGGICFVLIGLLNEIYSWDMLFQYQCIIGSLIITFLELISGIILNIILKLNIWDYSNYNFNILGQICLHHSIFFWIPLSAIAIILDDYIRYEFFNEEQPVYHFWHES